MEEITGLQAWLVLANMIGMVSVILSLYILVLNPRQLANLMASVAIAILTLNTLATASVLRATTYQEAYLPIILLAAIAPAVGPALFMVGLAILKPAWLSGKNRWISYLLLLLALVPAVLTIADVIAGTSIYFIGPDSAAYSTDNFQLANVLSNLVGKVVLFTNLIVLDALLIITLIYLGFFDRSLDKQSRSTARWLLVVQVLVLILSFAGEVIPRGILNLLISILYVTAYGIAAFRQLVSAHRVQYGRLQTRLTLLMVVIAVPAFIFIISSLIRVSGDYIEKEANYSLERESDYLITTVDTWMNDNELVLKNLSTQPDILSMDPARQKPALESYAKTYQFMYLISTTDLSGKNIARSDAAQAIDYNDRFWFQNAVSGAPITFQTLIGRTTGQPALVASVPIYLPDKKIAGVAMFASYLSVMSDEVLTVKLGDTGYAYLIDDKNQLVAHPDLDPNASEIVDYSTAPPVKALRQGVEPPITYRDENGVAWRAYYSMMDNGWAVVVQQQVAELFHPYRNLQLLSMILIIGGSLVIIVLVSASLRQAVQPINTLTEAVKDIASGNLERAAAVEGDDEVGTLARAFNIMTNQVRALVGSLERRVAERTLDLEHRSAQLQAAADVGRAAATIRNMDELLPLVTKLISERFGFYHVGIYFLDEQGEYAVLRATNSPGGQRMLARGHRLLVGQQGIVGHVTSRREPGVVLNVGMDSAFFNNPDLPDTQSEMALPLKVGGELLGVLDVQSVQPNAFTDQDVATLQVLADQVAIAINSAKLLEQTQSLLESERRSFGEITRRAWQEQIESMANVGFVREHSGLRSITLASNLKEFSLNQPRNLGVDQDDPHILYVPINVRGQVIGVLRLAHDQTTGSWTEEEIDMMKSLAEQLGVALESARAYQQTQITARRDRILGEISARVRETLDIHTILRTATQEVRQALDLPKVVIRLGTPPDNGGNGKSASGGNDA